MATKETSPELSSLASGVLSGRIKPTPEEVSRLAACVLSQDETGQDEECEPEAVMPSTNMDFGGAVRALKDGLRVTRPGWNGKGMFLFLLPAGTPPKTAIHDPALRSVVDAAYPGRDTFDALPSIRMFTADRKVLTGWLASQTDIFAEDWMVLG